MYVNCIFTGRIWSTVEGSLEGWNNSHITIHKYVHTFYWDEFIYIHIVKEWNYSVCTVYFLTYWHQLVQTIYIYYMQCTHDKLTSLSGNRKFVQFCIGLVVLIYLLNLYLVFTDSKIWFLKPLMDFYFQKEYENTWNCFVKLRATIL